MPLLTLIKKDTVRLPSKTKIIPAEEFSTLVTAAELMEQLQKEQLEYRTQVAKECELLKEQAELAGFQEGLQQWNAQLALLEAEIKKVSEEMENTMVPLAMTAVKRILGKELEMNPKAIVDIIATALKTVAHHPKVFIYVNKADLEFVEKEKQYLRNLCDHLQSFSISAREDIARGGCIIETEAGILNAQLDNQLEALEKAFYHFFQTRKKGKKG